MSKKELNKSGKRELLGQFKRFGVQAFFFYIASGTFSSITANVCFIILFVIAVIKGIIILRIIPELANERGQYKSDTKSWDIIVGKLFVLHFFIIIPTISGLDTRYNWSIVDNNIIIVGYIFFIIANALFQYSMIINKYFESTLKIPNKTYTKRCSTC